MHSLTILPGVTISEGSGGELTSTCLKKESVIEGINSNEQKAGNFNTNDQVVVMPAQLHMMHNDEREFDEEFEVFKTLYFKHIKSVRIEQLEKGDAELAEELEMDEEEDGEVEGYDVEGVFNSSNKVALLCPNAIFLVLMLSM